MAEQNQTVDRSYIDNFSIKDFAYNHLAPTFFDGIDINKLNVGAIGFNIEQNANYTEDAFNTSSILVKEAWVNRAQIPESIYSHAAIFQLEAPYAVPSHASFLLLIEIKDILDRAVAVNDFYEFRLDKDTKIQVEDKFFILDYDVIIKAQKKQGEWVFSASYDMSFDCSVCDYASPFIRCRRFNSGHLGIEVKARQMERTVYNETITSNTKINYPVLEFSFENQISGFDVFYTAPSDNKRIQLEKRVMYSAPVKTPFCYYKMVDEQKISISFSSKDGFFQPEFNSNIELVIYTTNGKEGDFDKYTGTEMTVITTGDNIESNDGLTPLVGIIGGSSGGQDRQNLDALQAITTEAYSTATELSTEADLRLFFYNYKYRAGSEIFFTKRRDDVHARIFSAFLIIKKDDYIYPANTLNLISTTNKADINIDNNRYIIRPGHLFTYQEGSKQEMVMMNGMCYDTLDLDYSDKFVYTNPFLISVIRKPYNLIGYYMTMVNDKYSLDFNEAQQSTTFLDFIAYSISIQRRLEASGNYYVELKLTPSVQLDDKTEIISKLNETTGNNLRVILSIRDKIEDLGYIELVPSEYSEKNDVWTFRCTITTDDYMTSTNKFRCLNMKKYNLMHDYVYAPMTDATVEVYMLFKSGMGAADIMNNKFATLNDEYQGYVVANKYSTLDTEPVTFIKPLGMIRSTVTYAKEDISQDFYDMTVTSVPVVGSELIFDNDVLDFFTNTWTTQYEYLESVLPRLRNNCAIDVKFYNTCGLSNNFIIGDEDERLDKVNIKIKFKVQPRTGADEQTLIRDLKIFIRDYIENVNNSTGSNDLYVSNLIKAIETQFTKVHHLRFMGINDYDSNYQTIINRTTDLNELTKEERRKYVPEILVVRLDDIEIVPYE